MDEPRKRGRPPAKAPGAEPHRKPLGDLMLEYHGLQSTDGKAGPPKKRPRYLTFRQQYRDDRVAFVHDCFDFKGKGGPVDYQEEILTLFPVKKRLAVRGPHGLGKTAIMAWLTWHFALTRDGSDWKCPSTASSWNQLIKYLWPEIHKWSKAIRWEVVGRSRPDRVNEEQTLALKLSTGEAFAVTSDQPELIEGCHADHLQFLFDESKAIPDKTFDAIEGAFSTPGEILAAAFSTPGDPSGRFYAIHTRQPGYEDWYPYHVTLDAAIRAGRVTQEWADKRKRQWGEDSSLYQNRVLGEFANSMEDGIIPLSWVRAAQQRGKELDRRDGWGPIILHGVDVAGVGQDACARAERHEAGVKEVVLEDHTSTMETCGKMKKAMDSKGGSAVIDTVGIGAGVYDRAVEIGLDVESFKSSKSAKGLTDKSGELTFLNLRAASWWQLRERLDPELGDGTALPAEDSENGKRVAEDLCAPKWTTASNGSIVVESKKDLRKRIGRSTDAGDAIVMAMFSDEGQDVEFH
jgi:hypothetical protein